MSQNVVYEPTVVTSRLCFQRAHLSFERVLHVDFENSLVCISRVGENRGTLLPKLDLSNSTSSTQ